MKAATLRPLIGQDVTVTQGLSLWSGRLMPDQSNWACGTVRFATKHVRCVQGSNITLKHPGDKR
jgi:hypothetical protein